MDSMLRVMQIAVYANFHCTLFCQSAQNLCDAEVAIHDVKACPILASWSASFDIKVLFPEPVTPMTAITISEDLLPVCQILSIRKRGFGTRTSKLGPRFRP